MCRAAGHDRFDNDGLRRAVQHVVDAADDREAERAVGVAFQLDQPWQHAKPRQLQPIDPRGHKVASP